MSKAKKRKRGKKQVIFKDILCHKKVQKVAATAAHTHISIFLILLLLESFVFYSYYKNLNASSKKRIYIKSIKFKFESAIFQWHIDSFYYCKVIFQTVFLTDF